MKFLVGCVAGMLFGAGLVIAEMTDPNRVLGFLDVTHWDPRLGFVMVGAIVVHAPVVLWLRRRGRPLLGKRIHLPERARVDKRLIIGAGTFGVGWGLAGYCPGPAITSAAMTQSALLLTSAMLVGMLLHDRLLNRSPVQAAAAESHPSGQGAEG